MELKIEIPKIHCKRTTSEITKDEIYYGIIAVGGKIRDGVFYMSNETTVYSKLSEITKKVKKGKTWRPVVNDHLIEFEGDIEALAVSLVLYEKDRGDIYDRLKEQFEEIIQPERFNWDEVIDEAKDLIIKDVNDNEKTDFADILAAVTTRPTLTPMILGGFLFKVAKKVVKYLRQDDLIGSVTDSFDLNTDGFDLPREYAFRGHKGKYQVGLKVTQLS